MEEKVNQKILEMLHSDVIEPVVGPPKWISPIVVRKHDIRLCINMKYANQAIQREHFPLPMIDTLLNKLQGSTFFSKIDLTSAFHHIELHPDSRGITTFMTNRGLMQFKRLMFGIICAAEIFQRVMSEMLTGIEGTIVYIDDVVISGKPREEHDARLQEVLGVLKDNNAKLNMEKCVFGVKKLEILGYEVSAAGISPSEDKIVAVRNFRCPETKEEVRSFLGLVNFIGHFIPDLSTRTEPLRQFIREKQLVLAKIKDRRLKICGSTNISDVCSRLCKDSEIPFDETTEHFLCSIGESPNAITLQEIKTETAVDETMLAVTEAIQTHSWPESLFRYQAFTKELGVIGGIIVREDKIILPPKLRERALEIAHRGHPGIVAMRRILREKVWWPYMDRSVGDFLQQCAGCAAVSGLEAPEPMKRILMPERAWQEIAIDFFSAKECATFLVLIDYYSRYTKVIEMKGTTARKTIDALESVFMEQSYPESIRSDNGPPFSSEEFSSYCVSKNIRLIRTIPYWPQMNGLVERHNQGLLRALRIAKAVKEDWRKAVSDYEHMYNTTPHSVTGRPPLELLTGRPIKDLLPSLRTEPYWQRDEETRDNDAIKKMKGKLYSDNRRNAKDSSIAVGDEVMLKNYETGKLESNFKLEKFTVDKRMGSDVIVSNDEGVQYRRSVSHMKKWPTSRELSMESQSDKLSQRTPATCSAEHSEAPSRVNEKRQGQRQLEDSPVQRPKRAKKLPTRYKL
ncbi:uncharacterized protein K02A2.6-like [Armigeres subalbatus]|uniref:uncharacterized protein K02A2.6-like n=1 Tax=Armigeres subalbatus TaxID=124917 RepID=UPI002ED56041